MICRRCGQRFGTIGVNYWDVKNSVCSFCEGKKNYETFFYHHIAKRSQTTMQTSLSQAIVSRRQEQEQPKKLPEQTTTHDQHQAHTQAIKQKKGTQTA
ncbi:MAG: hypothetical protein NT038_00805 [Euryarchaeota archaeon]|nr:hypothetical protein [Euryarchaeota archaeon]